LSTIPVTVSYELPMLWVGGSVAAWLAATPVLLPVLGKLIRAGQRVAPPLPEPLDDVPARPQLRLLPAPTV